MSERERIAYEELKPGDVIQEGDEWQNNSGCWHPLVLTPGASTQVRDSLRARRPYKISTILEVGDALANAQKAATQLQDERDEARAEVQRLQEVVGNLYSEPTARQVQQMLRTWATELDWSAGCFGSFGRSQIDIIQQTMIAVIQRIGSMIDPEATSAND